MESKNNLVFSYAVFTPTQREKKKCAPRLHLSNDARNLCVCVQIRKGLVFHDQRENHALCKVHVLQASSS